MAVGRISGPLLKSNLVRNGIDLAFETDLLYLDVNNQRIGIKNNSPQHELDINGNANANNLNISSVANIGDVTITGNTISTNEAYLNLGTADNVVYQNKAIIDSIEIEGNTISSNDSNANIELRPNGTGTVEVQSDMNVTGNIHATGNITADGDITIGDADTDNISFNADIASNLIPDADNTYTLGSATKRWTNVHADTINTTTLVADSVEVNGIDLTLTPGNTLFVAENGSDTNDGNHPQAPFASIKHALSQATGEETVYIYPGNYTEEFPLTIPVGVTVMGASIRSVNISPTTATRYNDCFLLNGESTVTDLTIKDFYSGGNYFDITEIVDADTFKVNVGITDQAHTYVRGGTVDFSDSTSPVNISSATYDETTGVLTVTTATPHDSYVGHSVFLSKLVFSCNGDERTFPDNGYGFRFATDFEVTTRSPYIKNVTVLTKGTVTSADDPRGFNAGDAGKGAYIDGAYATANSKEASMLFHSATFMTPNVDAITCTNGVRVEWLNSFTYFANRGFFCFDSNAGLAYEGKTRVRLSGVTGTFQAGDTVTFTSTDSSTVITATVDSIAADDSNVLLLSSKQTDLLDFDTTPQSITAAPSGASATTIENVDVRKFGAEVRMIGSASVYGNYGLWGDGPGVIIYAIGQNLAYIGLGKEVTNDADAVNQEDEIIELNDAKVRYNSVDHKGDFRVGDLFYVNQDDGSVSFVADALNIDLTDGATFNTDGNTTFINGERIDTGNLRLSGNTISSTAGSVNIDSFDGEINLKDNVNITGDLDVTGDLSIGGNITIGDEASDSLNIVAGIDSDLVPATTSTYSLGESALTWGNLYVDRTYVDDIKIDTNVITTTVSNADLELRANGTGDVSVPNNNVEIENDITINGVTTLADTTITGTLTHVGNYNQTGDTTVTGNVTVSQDLDVTGAAQFEEILVDDNFITTTTSNADLELRANGTGGIVIPNNNVTITQDLAIDGNLTVGDITSSGKIVADRFSTGNIEIFDNVITTTISNSDLELRANGTGDIVIDDFSFNGNTISSTGDMTITPGSGIMNIDSTGSLRLPVGTTLERPTEATGQVRFNTTTSSFEGYNGSQWLVLHGIADNDGDTKITPELTPGANDNIIRFIIEGSTVATLDTQEFEVPKAIIDDIQIDGNVISTITSDTDLEFTANGTGSVVFDYFAIKDNTITNTEENTATVFNNTGSGYVKFSGTNGFVIPVGDNTNKPAPAYRETGMIRYNTADARVEVFDGTSWVSVAGSSGGISAIDAENIAIVSAIIFG